MVEAQLLAESAPRAATPGAHVFASGIERPSALPPLPEGTDLALAWVHLAFDSPMGAPADDSIRLSTDILLPDLTEFTSLETLSLFGLDALGDLAGGQLEITLEAGGTLLATWALQQLGDVEGKLGDFTVPPPGPSGSFFGDRSIRVSVDYVGAPPHAPLSLDLVLAAQVPEPGWLVLLAVGVAVALQRRRSGLQL